MANKSSGADVICPFFQNETQKSISCEGMLPDTVCMTRFEGDVERKAAFQARYCETHDYKRCPIAEALLWKYEREGRN